MKNTKIDWCDCTINPVVGCKNGCQYCYARKINSRFHLVEKWECPQFFPDRLLQFNNKKAKSVFINSMSDISQWEKEWLDKTFDAIRKNRQHNYIALTTFTHSGKVDFDKNDKKKPIEKHDIVQTKKLNKNVDYKQKGNVEYSHVVPRVYEGSRSALGKGTNQYRLDKSDEPLIDDIFRNGKRYKVPRTDNNAKEQKKNRW